MGWRRNLLVLAAALAAGCLGLVASVALRGPGPLLRSELGQRVLSPWLRGRSAAGLEVVELGSPVAAIRLPDRAGRPQVLPAPGRAVLVNYWASWCAPCREEMPLLAGYSAQALPGHPDIVSIALDNRQEAEAFLDLHPLPFPTLIEPPGPRDSSARLGNGRGVLPFSVLIGADGRLQKRRFGAFQDAADLESWASNNE